MTGLPWATWARRCHARLTAEQNPARYGRCELRRGHAPEDHALEYGMWVVRWPDPPVWDSDDRTGQRPVGEMQR